MPGAMFPVRIEIPHLVSDEPTWIQERDGTKITAPLPNADLDAGDIDDRGGLAFDDEWERVFGKRNLQEGANKIIDLQNSAGFTTHPLPHRNIG